MTDRPDPREDSPNVDHDMDEVLRDPDAMRWFGAHLDELRASVVQRRFRNQLVWTGVIAGLVAHIGGYLLRRAGPAEPLGLIADLLYALGLAVWTGTVVVVLVEIIPEAKERQILKAIDAYEAAAKRDAAKRRG